jgi:hypothetical protein
MGAFVILTTSAAAWAADEARDGGEAPARPWVSVSGLLAGRYEAVWNVDPALDRPFDRNDSAPLAYLTTTLSVRPTDALRGVITLASREISRDALDNGAVEDRWETTRFIDEAWVKAEGNATWLKIGKQRLIVGRGLVLDSYQPAISAGADAPPSGNASLRLKAFGARLDEDGVLRRGQSLYAGGRVDLTSFALGRLSASISRVRDRDALIPRLLPTNISLGLRDAPFEADHGALTYWIVDASGAAGRWTVDAVGVVQTGALSGVLNNPLVPPASRPRTIDLLGRAAEIRAARDIGDRLRVGAFALYTSGDRRGTVETLRDRRYEAFIGIFPLIDATNLFFRGGLDAAFKAGQPSASGVHGRGVIAGALTADVAVDRFALRVVAADLWSEYPDTGSAGRHYGVEVDTEWAYRVTGWFTTRLEGDALVPGSFYRSAAAPDPEPVYKLVVGGDVSW